MADYFETGSQRMRRTEFRGRRRSAGSGVVEVGGKTIIGSLREPSGRFRTVREAHAVMAHGAAISA